MQIASGFALESVNPTNAQAPGGNHAGIFDSLPLPSNGGDVPRESVLKAERPIADIGEKILDRLEEFASRANQFAKLSFEGSTPSSPTDDRVKNAVTTLEKMFDHSIEVQLVVRGTTQLSGSANTLLRGQ